MTITNVGSSKAYANNWNNIFTGSRKKTAATAAPAGKVAKSAKKTASPKKKAAKKKGKK